MLNKFEKSIISKYNRENKYNREKTFKSLKLMKVKVTTCDGFTFSKIKGYK